MVGMAWSGKERRLVNPRLELSDLLNALPRKTEVSDEEREGRVPLPPGTRLKKGDYVLRELIGCGSFGLIYEATDKRIGQCLAIKEFFPSGFTRAGQSDWSMSTAGRTDANAKILQAQFEEEFRVLERFERPGIVKVYDLFQENGGVFLVMERLVGATLEDILTRFKSLEEPLALWLIRRLVSTLETIHLSGLVHGDIKPENLFLTSEGQLILLDFGAVNHYLTRDKSGPRFLTPGYAPPEQYLPQRTPDPASDLYAVGATLYELLTGTAPPDSVKRTKGVRLPAPNRRGANASAQTVTVLGRTLALAQEKRPASAHALLGLLPEVEMKVVDSARPWTEINPLTGHYQGVRRLQLTSDGEFLASADKSGQLRLWSMEKERCLGVIELGKEVTDTAIHPSDSYLAVALSGGDVELIEFSTGRTSGTFRSGAPPVSSVAFSPDGVFLVCGLFDGRVELRPMAQKGKKKILRAHDAPVNHMCFSPSGRLLALASNDRSASVWDLRSGRRVRCFEGHHRPVQVCKFSPDGRFLLTGGSDMSIRVFDLKRGDEFRRLKGHEAMVWDLLYLESSNLLLSCSADRTVRLWDMSNFREMDKVSLSDGWLCSMVFHRQTSTLLVGGVDKVIHRLLLSDRVLGVKV
jgi:Protein kinase domain/WD domain, G-beta repeat